MKIEEFNHQKYINQLNRYDTEKCINRVKPLFFDEDTNDIFELEQFIVSKVKKMLVLLKLKKKKMKMIFSRN